MSNPQAPALSFASFEEFFPFYLTEHSNATNRRLHFLGSTLALCALARLVMTGDLLMIPTALVMGYGCAWIGHFFVEKNKPASFKWPLWSFMGDWKMYSLMLRGQLWS